MRMAIQFDTLRYVEKLKSAGIPEVQAKAEAEVLAAALGESASGSLATKDDITGIKLDLVEVKAEQKLMKWMLGLIFAGVVALVMKSFF
ncbi:MAG: hypothetical protein ABTQ26_14235 [Azonexus sp.]|jgi:hypothetical protein